ncbi:hypothetical protein TWF102_009912 [Orbilia oligospora]|uniref:DUF1746 domain-containing protein n=1 Tax=Orbilia oligospora TaxID=2813651 RepID=A0A7C8NTD5_ORBOL|nr:hypothetical protein TWF103_002263 [Orbilia oligospora]KAF3109135.1 hypothetical protein TWF102_009912 [Orbilia oligospora]KAF3127106.1 hypothetical protein TWF703_010054 [Orbilia oligospora]KAF3152957.1 hypothetical protein TWF594_000013 [Orbilia oligospora]
MPAGSSDDDANAPAVSSALHSNVRARDQLTTKKSECISFIRFLIRAIVQINLFAQRPPNFPTPQRTQKRSAVVSIFGSTLICFLFHLFSEPASGSEATGGYLHGGMIIDFVGQEGPISRLRLIFLDLIILLLQLTMLTVKVSKQDLLDSSGPNRVIPAQDLDDEERGIVASAEDDNSDFAASPIEGPNSSISSDGLRRRRPAADSNIYSGEVNIADLRIVETVRSQWNSQNNTPITQSASATMAANLANARLRMLFRR